MVSAGRMSSSEVGWHLPGGGRRAQGVRLRPHRVCPRSDTSGGVLFRKRCSPVDFASAVRGCARRSGYLATVQGFEIAGSLRSLLASQDGSEGVVVDGRLLRLCDGLLGQKLVAGKRRPVSERRRPATERRLLPSASGGQVLSVVSFQEVLVAHSQGLLQLPVWVAGVAVLRRCGVARGGGVLVGV